MTKKELFDKADEYKEKISGHRPLKDSELNEIDNYFKIGLTYTSNALEGNTLTLSETKILLEDGLTVGGKPIKDYYEAVGHSRAYDFMLTTARSNELKITEQTINRLHYLFYSGINPEEAGHYRKQQVYISGSEYLPPEAEKVPMLMKELVIDMDNMKDKLHPIEYAAMYHKKFVDIHPYTDGNGRTARLIMNIILVSKGYGTASIPPVLRKEYIDSLIISQRASNPSIEPFVKLIAECVIETEKDYCRLLRI